MTDAAVALELRRLVGEVAELRALLERRAPALHQRQQRVITALYGVFGASVFTSEAAAAALDLQIASRRELRDALTAACRGRTPTAQRVGHVLRAIVDAGGTAGAWRLVDCGTEAGSRLWGIEGATSR